MDGLLLYIIVLLFYIIASPPEIAEAIFMLIASLRLFRGGLEHPLQTPHRSRCSDLPKLSTSVKKSIFLIMTVEETWLFENVMIS